MEAFGIYNILLDSKNRVTIPASYGLEKKMKHNIYVSFSDNQYEITDEENLTDYIKNEKKDFERRINTPIFPQSTDLKTRIIIDRSVWGEKNKCINNMVVVGKDTHFLLKPSEMYEVASDSEIMSSEQRLFIRPKDEKITAIKNEPLRVKKYKFDTKSRAYLPKEIWDEGQETVYFVLTKSGLKIYTKEQLIKVRKQYQEEFGRVFSEEWIFKGNIYPCPKSGNRLCIPKELQEFIAYDGEYMIAKTSLGIVITNPLYYTDNEIILSDELLERQQEAEKKLIKRA